MTHWSSTPLVDKLASVRESAADLDAAWADPRSVVARFDERFDPVLAGDQLACSPASGRRRDDDLLLGLLGGRIWWARLAPASGVSLRSRALAPGEQELAMTARALLEWHALERACPKCASETVTAGGGAWRVCPRCGHIFYPRQDPAVIVAVTDATDRLLLAHHVAWPATRVSILAGYVEAGESAEQAAHREVMEETQVSIERLRYAGSQPWPFPRSFMLGFTALATTAAVQPCGREIDRAWFATRAEVHQRLAEGSLSLPGHSSIARRLIERWRGGSVTGMADVPPIG